MTERKNVIMGSFKADFSLQKWQLIQERDRLFDSYCESLEKLTAWNANGSDMIISIDKKNKLSGLQKVKALILKNMEELSAKLVELDEQINELGHNEPPDELTSHDDHTS